MIRLYRLILISTAMLCLTAGSWAAGEWTWLINTNPISDSLNYVGNQGTLSPIALTGIVFNNDDSNTLAFDGITLKLDESNGPADLTDLWETLIPGPESFLTTGGDHTSFDLGVFDLSKARPGLYTLYFVAAGRFDDLSTDAYQSEITSGAVRITVVEVPEPSSLAALLVPFTVLLFRKRDIS